MIAPERDSGREVLDRFTDAGYRLWLEGGEIRASGPAPPGEDLRALAEEHSDRLKAAVLLSDPPPWLAKLFNLWWGGHETPVRLSAPSGKAEVYVVAVSIRNITAAVGAEIGLSRERWPEIQPEVEEVLGAWEGAP